MFTDQPTRSYDQALITVAHKLNDLGIKWRLFASGALYSWGVKIIPKDIDIFVSKSDLPLLEREFTDNLVNPLHSIVENGTKYLEFQLNISGVEVEICELDDLGEVVPLEFNGETFYVAPLVSIRDEYLKSSSIKDRLTLIDLRIAELNQKTI